MTRIFLSFARVFLIVAALICVLAPAPAPASAAGTTQIGGIGYFDAAGDCSDPEGAGADFTLVMTGDLSGCLYQFIETVKCSPSGAYVETGTEVFVGQYAGESGSFTTTYRFTAKYNDCPNYADQIFGRCQHPIVVGSGRGVFSGVTGRLDFKDDIEAGNAVYRGHLSW